MYRNGPFFLRYIRLESGTKYHAEKLGKNTKVPLKHARKIYSSDFLPCVPAKCMQTLLLLFSLYLVYLVTYMHVTPGCCCCSSSSHIHSHNQVRGHRTGSSNSGAEEYPWEKAQTNRRWYTHVSRLYRDFERTKHVSRISAGAQMCLVKYRRPS